MAVTSVRLKDVDGIIDKAGERQYTVTYHVDTDSVNDGPITARDASGIPARFDSFSFGSDSDPGAYLVSKRARLLSVDDTYKVWIVTCQYTSLEQSFNQSAIPVDDPLLKPTKWSGSFVQFQREYLKDKDAKTIKNSAGDPLIDPAVTGDDSRLSIIAEKNFSSLNVSFWSTYRDAVNDATWWGLAARGLKVQSITWDQAFHKNDPFYVVRFEFHVNDQTWDFEELDAGYYELESGSGERTRIKDKYLREINKPWPLNTNGSKMASTDIDADNENYLTWRVYPEKDYSALGLPAVIGAP